MQRYAAGCGECRLSKRAEVRPIPQWLLTLQIPLRVPGREDACRRPPAPIGLHGSSAARPLPAVYILTRMFCPFCFRGSRLCSVRPGSGTVLILLIVLAASIAKTFRRTCGSSWRWTAKAFVANVVPCSENAFPFVPECRLPEAPFRHVCSLGRHSGTFFPVLSEAGCHEREEWNSCLPNASPECCLRVQLVTKKTQSEGGHLSPRLFFSFGSRQACLRRPLS